MKNKFLIKIFAFLVFMFTISFSMVVAQTRDSIKDIDMIETLKNNIINISIQQRKLIYQEKETTSVIESYQKAEKIQIKMMSLCYKVCNSDKESVCQFCKAKLIWSIKRILTMRIVAADYCVYKREYGMGKDIYREVVNNYGNDKEYSLYVARASDGLEEADSLRYRRR